MQINTLQQIYHWGRKFHVNGFSIGAENHSKIVPPSVQKINKMQKVTLNLSSIGAENDTKIIPPSMQQITLNNLFLQQCRDTHQHVILLPPVAPVACVFANVVCSTSGHIPEGRASSADGGQSKYVVTSTRN